MVEDQKSEPRVYLRRSETKQEMSLQDQLKIALGRAAEVGVSIQATLADVEYMQAHRLLRHKDLYLDDGLKGDDLERPAFQQMCEELQSRDTVG
jgi:DNA invertase Pin-like site-specific DNA recombinase